LVSQLDAGNIEAYRSVGNGSDTNPHTHRCSFDLKGFTASPSVDYVPVLTKEGDTFMKEFYEKSDSLKAFSLLWNYEQAQETLKSLIGFHCDQSKLDIDKTGEPNKFINREVASVGMPYKLMLQMLIVWYEDDGSGTMKKCQRKIASCEIKIAGGHYSYCMDAVASGRHSGYKMIIPSEQFDGVTGGLYDIIIQHATKRVDTNTAVKSRMIINSDYSYNSAAEAASGLDAFMDGTQDSKSLREWLTNSVTNEANTSPAWIDSTITSLHVHEAGDRLWCRSCAHGATCVDKRPLPSNVVQNNNGVSLIQGSAVVVYWGPDELLDPKDTSMMDDDLSELAYVGVITHVAMDGNRVTSVNVTFVEGDSSSSPRSHCTLDDSDAIMNLLYPAEEEDIVKLLGNRDHANNDSIHRSTLCDECARADQGLILTKALNLLENPCKLCCKEDILPRCAGCANCLGNPTCRGVPGEGDTRKFYCAGIDEDAKVGVPLTVANSGSGQGYICRKCQNV
jgi:hypothetical protein